MLLDDALAAIAVRWQGPAPASARPPAEAGDLGFVTDLAAGLHDGHSWEEVVPRLRQPARAFRQAWRAKVRQRIL